VFIQNAHISQNVKNEVIANNLILNLNLILAILGCIHWDRRSH